jgi:hypothetical protein
MADLFRQSIGMKNLKYTKYSCVFHTSTCQKISHHPLLLIDSELPCSERLEISMKQKFRFTAEPRSALCLLSMALMLLSAAARLWYYLADPVATAMTLSQADIFLLVGLPVFSAALYLH